MIALARPGAQSRGMEMDPKTIRALLDAFERSDWREMEVVIGDARLHVSRDPTTGGTSLSTSPVPSDAPAGPTGPSGAKADGDAPDRSTAGTATTAETPPGPTAEAPSNGTVIESPSVGLFWRAPAPGAAPFVEVGDRVSDGDTVAIVEVMKLMNHVASPVSGVVSSILVENGGPVEYGQPLVVVDPEG
jgi:acetyl-CoA carboxylase biotin carboxyl carrier protein